MRLLLTTDTIGGVWTYAIELAKALRPHGVHILLAALGASCRQASADEVQRLDHVEVIENANKLEWMPEPWDDLRRTDDWLLELEEDFRPDIVHLNQFVHGALPWKAPVMVVGHSCVLSWWEAVKGTPAPSSWNRYRDEVGAGLRAADLVAAPTGAMLNALLRHYGPLAQARIIPNGRDASLFIPAPKEPLILSAGRLWDEAKNVAALERVAPKLPWPVYVAGEHNTPTAAAANVHRLGQLSSKELHPWFARTSIYVLPARYEPFGLSALEAGLSGCALVLGDIASLREVWGDAALFVPPDDHVALLSAIQNLITNPRLRRIMSDRARAVALRYWTERMAEGYLAAYRTLLRQHRGVAKAESLQAVVQGV